MNAAQENLVGVFSALGDPTRLATVQRLAEGPSSVGVLAEPFGLSPAGFSKHLRVLQHAGLVTKELDGRRHMCRLEPAPLRAAYTWLATYERFWASALDGLEAFIDENGDQE